ncbi:MAG: spermidine synthase [Symploca sp. SIO2B6]|nr:spermidine synthase [Symploca sp. SIO2B6]
MSGPEEQSSLWINEYHTPWDLYAHGVQRILAHCQTPYQEMYVVETGAYGKGLVLDGKWQSSVGDEFLYHEPLVHPGCVLHGHPRQVLVLGGGEGATVREVLRWNTVEKVVMVDIDGDVVEACKTHLPEMHQGVFDDPRLELVIDDALTFLDRTSQQWDVIISDLTDPIENGPAFPLFTQEHFFRIRDVLSPTGFYMLQGGALVPPELSIHARTVNTLKTVFHQVSPVFCYAPTYGVSLGLILSSMRPFSTRPDPDRVDQLLQEKTIGGFKMFDGTSFLGMLQLPLYIREAIATETAVYTMASPPKPMGKGSMQG